MNTITMYSLYNCDSWRSSESMQLEYETLSECKMNDYLRKMIKSNPGDFNIDEHSNIDLDHDNLAELVENQNINFLDITIREINIDDDSVEIVG